MSSVLTLFIPPLIHTILHKLSVYGQNGYRRFCGGYVCVLTTLPPCLVFLLPNYNILGHVTQSVRVPSPFHFAQSFG